MTKKRYYEDAYLQTFQAGIISRGKEADGTSYVVLDQTAFYPTGGGQPSDLGYIADVAVVDVEEVDGEIRHRLAAPLADEIVEVTGTIDWERRFDHMQQHTGQHILSAAFDELIEAPTVAFHLGRETVTIDIATSDLSAEKAQVVERLANQIVLENRDITARFVDEAELAAMPLRKPPTVTENIRIVAIDRFDYNPCGGTHPARTGEVGMIKILGWEKAKGNTRVEFVCGLRALASFGQKQTVIKELTRLLAAQEFELPAQITRLLAERKELEYQIGEFKSLQLEQEARELLNTAVPVRSYLVVKQVFANRTIQELQKLAQLICTQNPAAIALLAGTGAKTQLVFSRGTDVKLAMNALLKETLVLIDGKGGGSLTTAQGGGESQKPADELLVHASGLIETSEE
ncbi:alanyl-tRNA editing protein [Brevibacillus fluminis]|uniref:Alanyl-tRNA editing protein n=1 Tax=Brevibacillus fluminis TaxID=511487 RepID=A0A3M8D8T1_9BACL|nr:DHHA1 domain-containing protein [Brevibacillus fluminis]RNB84442.1 alanyl-tRNA editing protein [Brevibacillus fluminis]